MPTVTTPLFGAMTIALNQRMWWSTKGVIVRKAVKWYRNPRGLSAKQKAINEKFKAIAEETKGMKLKERLKYIAERMRKKE